MRHHGHSQPHQPDDSSNDGVRYFPFDSVPAELETQAPVDDAERHDDATPPDVGDGPDCALGGLAVDFVVEDCENGLEVQAADDDDADDGMSVAFSGDLQYVIRLFVGRRIVNQGCDTCDDGYTAI